MTAYLGSLGRLVPVSCPSVLAHEFVRPATDRVTLGGRRTVRMAVRGHRSWSVSTSAASPLDLAGLAAVARGDFGPGPFWWVDEWAQQSNLLDPRDAALEAAWGSATLAGPVVLPGGPVVARHVRTGVSMASWAVSPHGGYLRAPVVPGQMVTVSAWVDASSQSLRYVFQNAAEVAVGSTSAVSGVRAGWHRVSRTVTAPVGAASVVIGQSGLGGLAAPAVTWTSDLREYGAGAGARNVIVTGYSEDVRAAWKGAMYADQSYQIVEVG